MKRSQIPAIAALAAAAALTSACGNSEPPSMKARANAPLHIPEPKADAAAGTPEANEALKERLARQEAATKLFEKTRSEAAKPEAVATRAETAPVKAEAAPARAEPAAARQEPVRLASAAPTQVPMAAPAQAPAAVPAKAAEAAPPKAADPAKAEPAKAENVKLASAAPTSLPPMSGLIPAKLVSRVDPEFPREAVQAGADKGNVKARMTLDSNGNVMRVEVVEAMPRRVFDRAVVRALSQWRFSDGPSGRTVETEVEFKR